MSAKRHTRAGPPADEDPDATAAGRPDSPAPTRDAIAARAHELYVARGCVHGSDCDDWLQAEQELRAVRLGERSV